MKKTLTKKGIMLAVAIVLLVSIAVYATTAWYTKMTSVRGMSFDVAQWDFNAAYQVEDTTVNVYSYTSLTDQKAAPGTAGWIPLVIDASASDTDIDVRIMVDESSMSQEFQDRLTFYFKENPADEELTAFTENNSYDVTIQKLSSETITLYWDWVYENPDDEATQEQKDEWDRFDTQVGKKPYEYEPLMNATIRIVGSQVLPTRTA